MLMVPPGKNVFLYNKYLFLSYVSQNKPKNCMCVLYINTNLWIRPLHSKGFKSIFVRDRDPIYTCSKLYSQSLKALP